MCGRYYADDSTEQKIRELTGKNDRVRIGEIRPSEPATVLAARGEEFWAEDMIWGFPSSRGRGLLINARAETITERRTFRDSVRSRRCVVPAKGFYEWSRDKEKYRFEEPSMTLFMAGCYDAQHRFVILTTTANASVSPVHGRMPLLLGEEEIGRWLNEMEAPTALLGKTQQALSRFTPYRQMTLFEQTER